MTDDEGKAVAPELVREIESLASDLAAQPERADLAHRFEWLIDTLILRGHLKPGHRKLVAKVRGDRSKVFLSMFKDKRSMASPDVDCAALLPICKARCCSFAATLSAEDLAEGELRWDIYEPYRLPRDHRTGYCRYLRADGGCGTYENRPGTCRDYDCRDDPRVWIDFDKRIPAPLPPHVIPLGEWLPDPEPEE